MKISKLRQGDVLEVPLAESGFGYVSVLGNDEFGTMFEIFSGVFQKPLDEREFDQASLPTLSIAYVNSAAAKKCWKLRFRKESGLKEMPKSFYGSPDRWWFVKDGGQIRKISPKEVPYDEMIAMGYVHKALWLPKDVERLLTCGQPLKWTQWG